MAATTTATEAEMLKEHWNETFLEELREGMVFYDLGLKSQAAKQEGTTVHWLALADMSAAAALTEATDPTEYTLSAGDMTAALKQYGASVLVSDLLQDTIIGTGMNNIMERIGRNAAKTLDIVVRNAVLSGCTNVRYGGTAVARNSIATASHFDFSVTTIRKARNFFNNANAQPLDGKNYVAVAAPNVIYDLQGDSNWTNAHIYAGENTVEGVYKGESGKLYGVRFIENTNALELVASGSASTDVFQTYFVGKEGFGVSELYDPQIIAKNPHPASDLDLYASYGWKGTFATRELQASALLRYETGASLSD